MKNYIKVCLFYFLLIGSNYVIAETTNKQNVNKPSPFKFSYQIIDSKDFDKLILKWTIENGSYIYKNRIKFKADSTYINVKFLDSPKNVYDKGIGEYLQVFKDKLDIEISTPKIPEKKKIQVTIQGCSSAGVCYLPMTEIVTL